MHASRFITAGLALASLTLAARAHEFWIQPGSFQPGMNRTLTVGLRVGEGFTGKPVLRDGSRIDRFEVVGPTGTHTIPGRDGSQIAGRLRVQEAGVHVLAYQNHPASIQLGAEDFAAYLKEDGLEKILDARRARGEDEAAATELYSRCAKCLLDVGATGDSGWDRRLGLTLEIIPEANPLDAAVDQLPIRVLFNGEPCAGLLIRAVHADEPTVSHLGRTDGTGHLTINLDRPGVWLISGVEMVRAAEGTGANWRSYWTSLTFDHPAAETATAEASPATTSTTPSATAAGNEMVR